MSQYEYDYDIVQFVKEDYEDQLHSLFDEENKKSNQENVKLFLEIKEIAEFLSSDIENAFFFNKAIPIFKAKFFVENNNKNTWKNNIWNVTNSIPANLTELHLNDPSHVPFVSDNPNGYYKVPTDALALVSGHFVRTRILPHYNLEFIGLKLPRTIRLFNLNKKIDDEIMNKNYSLSEQFLDMALHDNIRDYQLYSDLINNSQHVTIYDVAIFIFLAENILIPLPFDIPDAAKIDPKNININVYDYQKIKPWYPKTKDVHMNIQDEFKNFKGKKDFLQKIELDEKTLFFELNYNKITEIDDETDLAIENNFNVKDDRNKFANIIGEIAAIFSCKLHKVFFEVILSYLNLNFLHIEQEIENKYNIIIEDNIKRFHEHLAKVQKSASHDAEIKIKSRLMTQKQVDISKERLNVIVSIVFLFTLYVIISRPKQVLKTIDTRFYSSAINASPTDTQIHLYMKYFFQILFHNKATPHQLSFVYLNALQDFLIHSPKNLGHVVTMAKDLFVKFTSESPSFLKKIEKNEKELEIIASRSLKDVWPSFRPIYKQFINIDNELQTSVFITMFYDLVSHKYVQKHPFSHKNAYYPTHFNMLQLHMNYDNVWSNTLVENVYNSIPRTRVFVYDIQVLRFNERKESVIYPAIQFPKTFRNVHKPINIDKYHLQVTNGVSKFLHNNSHMFSKDTTFKEVKNVPNFIKPYIKDNPVLIVFSLLRAILYASVQGQRFAQKPSYITPPKYLDANKKERIEQIWNKYRISKNLPVLKNTSDLLLDNNNIIENEVILFQIYESVYGDSTKDVAENAIQTTFIKTETLINEFETARDQVKQKILKNREEERRRQDDIRTQLFYRDENTTGVFLDDMYDLEYEGRAMDVDELNEPIEGHKIDDEFTDFYYGEDGKDDI